MDYHGTYIWPESNCGSNFPHVTPTTFSIFLVKQAGLGMGPQYLTRWPPSSQVMSKTGEWVHSLAEVPPSKTPLLTPTIFPPSQQELGDLHLERWWANYPLHITCSEDFESGDETLARPDTFSYICYVYTNLDIVIPMRFYTEGFVGNK